MNEFVAFIEDYGRSWAKAIAAKDISHVRKFFNEPSFSVGPDGSVTPMTDARVIDEFNRARLAQFLNDDAPLNSFRGCDAMTLGTQSALVSVNWELRRNDGTMVRAWRHYYNVLRTPAGLKILVSTFSAGSHG